MGRPTTDMDIELTNEAITNRVERCGEFTSKESNIKRLGSDGRWCGNGIS